MLRSHHARPACAAVAGVAVLALLGVPASPASATTARDSASAAAVPTIRIGGPRRQVLWSRRSMYAEFTCSDDCTADIGARVKVSGHNVVHFSETLSFEAGTTERIRFTPSVRHYGYIRNELRRGATVRFKVAARVLDGSLIRSRTWKVSLR